MELRPEDRLILSCIKISTTSKELEQINGLISQVLDWDYLIATIINRGIGSLLYKKLPLLTNRSLIPEPIKKKLQQAYYKTFSRSAILIEHFQRIANALAKNNIPLIALKGIYLSEWLYNDIGLRQFSDIDLLVKVEDGENCIAILAGLGYKPFNSEESKFIKSQLEIIHYTPMIMDGVSIEIHVKLHWETEKYHLEVDELWNNSIPVTLHNTSVFALNTNDLLIHLCIHLDKHFREGHVQFTCFNDITNLLDIYVGIIDWSTFIKTTRNYNCENTVFKYFILVNKYMNAPLPDTVVQKYSSLMTTYDERLFYRYLNGYAKPFTAVPQHLGNLKSIDTSAKIRYIWDVLFPPRAFMMIKYQINHRRLVLFYYPYRYWMGVKGLLKMLIRTPKPLKGMERE